MKVVMTVSNPMKPDPRVYKEAKSLAKAGHEVYVIAWDREGKYPPIEETDGLKIIRVGPRAGYGPLMALKLPLFYLNAFKWIVKLEPDVIHTHDFDTAIMGFIFQKLKDVKWVYDVHDLYESFVKLPKLKKMIQLIDSLFLKSSNAIISVNNNMTYIILEWGVRNQIITVMNTVNPFPIKRKKFSRFTVFYGGVLSRGRFILEMIEISEKLNFKLRIAGRGILEKEISKTEGNVIFLGVLPHSEAITELAQSHLTFILYDPSEINNRIASPNKLFEAMWVGTPPLVVKNTLPDKLLGKAGIPVEYDKNEVINVLKQLINNPKEIKKKAIVGKRMFLKNYTWEKMEKRLTDLYSFPEMMGGR